MARDVGILLADLRNVVLAGNYDRLAEIIPQLASAESELSTVDPQMARTWKAEALRTAACLESAMSGLKSARRRVAEIGDAARGLATYDHTGAKSILPFTRPPSRRV